MAISMEQLCGSNFSYQHRPLEECFRDMAELGRKRIELWGIAPQAHVPWLSEEEAREIAQSAAGFGLEVICFTPEQVMYPVNIASPDERMREHGVDTFLRAAELAVELGASRLFLTPGRGFEGEPVEPAWQRAVDSLGRIVTRAESLGLDCVLEPLQRVESNLVNTAAQVRRMVAEVGSPALGVALDTVAMSAAGETVDDYFAELGGLVRHVHLIDGTPAGHLAWGDGELPLAEILASLGNHEFSGPITVEMFGDGSYAFDPQPHLQRSLAAIEAAL